MNEMNGTRTRITSTKTNNTFTAMVFDTKVSAEVFAVKNPVLVRNASGSLLRHPAPVVRVGKRFGVII